jgi:hypothetical protein
MKKLRKLLVLGLIACSCVNEAYDLNNVDGTAVIMKDFAMPIGNLESIKINDIIPFDDASMIAKDADGNLFLQFRSSDFFSESITIPSFTIPFTDVVSESDLSLEFKTGALAGHNGTIWGSKRFTLPQNFKKSIKIDAQLPSEVLDAEYVQLAVGVQYSFTVESGIAYIAKGFKLDFPDWMTVVKTDENDAYVLENDDDNKNVVSFVADKAVADGAPLEINLMITKIVFPEGCLVDGKVTFDETDVLVNGDIYMDAKDYPVIPESLKVCMDLDFSDFNVKSARLSLGMDMEFAGQDINLPEYPELFKSEGFVLDIYDVLFYFNVKNTLPLGLELNADFKAFKNSDMIDGVHIGANSPNGTAPLLIPAETENTSLVFSKLGKDGAISLPLLGDILIQQPDKIRVSDVVVTLSRDFIEIVPGATYDCAMGYELYAPLAFGKDFRLQYDLGLSDLAMDLSGYGISNAVLTMSVTNSIPLNFSLSSKALDADGQPVEGLDIDVVGIIASGVHGKSVTSDVELHLKSTGESVNFSSLDLTLVATAPAENHLGTALNEQQGLDIKGISLRLPDGVTVDSNSLFAADTDQEKVND